tara:strand:- start:127 stop:783 length:657 start_codon:yes stop_codon:yes gene_type:complete
VAHAAVDMEAEAETPCANLTLFIELQATLTELSSMELLPYLKNLVEETGWLTLVENASKLTPKEKLSSSRLPTTAHQTILHVLTALLISISPLQVSITQETVSPTAATVFSLTTMPCMFHKPAPTGQTKAAIAMPSVTQLLEKVARTSSPLAGTTQPSRTKKLVAHQNFPCLHHACPEAIKSGEAATTVNALHLVHTSSCFCSYKALENDVLKILLNC